MMDWRTPYRWTIAGPAWMITGPTNWPEIELAYIFNGRAIAEAWLQKLRQEYGETSLRAVPVPYIERRRA